MDSLSTVKIQNKLSDPFAIERLRILLSKGKKYNELRETYSKKNPSIPNLNTTQLWDQLNDDTYHLLLEGNNPMALDRVKIVAHNIFQCKDILDVGFGSGCLEEALKNSKLHVTAIDFSQSSVDRAKDLYPDWEFFVTDFLKPWGKKLHGRVFDCIVSLEVLEHIPPENLFQLLSELSNHLVENGLLVISVPLNEGLEEMVKDGINPNAHVRTYTIELLKAELEIAGFQPKKHYFLWAFSKNYFIKKFICNLFPRIKKPNNLIVVAQKV